MRKEILDGNKLIAAFMDNILLPSRDYGINVDMFQIGVWQDEYADNKLISRSPLDDSYAVIRNTIPYHSDWNWLMTVVDKIESLSVRYHVHIKSDYSYREDEEVKTDLTSTQQVCIIQDGYSIVSNSAGHGDEERNNKLRATYVAVIHFIKWYNNLKKK